jgi:hypothetical protein
MKILKITAKVILAGNILFGFLLLIGVLLPKETYKQNDDILLNILITNCNIVDVKTGVVIPNRHIVIQNGRIISIDSIAPDLPQNSEVINAAGRYLLPSLWDMHIHTLSLSPQLHFPLLIANGVTRVRDMGDGDSWISDIEDDSPRDRVRWQKEEKENGLLIPKIIESTSYHIEELEDINDANFKEKIELLVKRLKVRGEPFLKVQLEGAELPDYIFYELQHQAKKQDITILGHLSPNLDIHKVVDNGFKSIEHAWALIPHFTKVKSNLDRDIEQKTYDLKNQDTLLTDQILLKIAVNNTFYCPTHVTSNRKEYLAFDPDFNNNPNNAYTENIQLGFWSLINWLHTKGYDQHTDLPILKGYYERGLEITKLASQHGVKILAGTDALDRNVYYGISLHHEMEEMVKAGLSNAEALRTATINAAEYYELENEYGSIEVGKVADFILLGDNPLENIKNTQTISAVFYNNRWYDESDIEEMKSFTREQAKSFGISCKFIWNMMKSIF